MIFQQQHLPQERDASPIQEWGFTLWEFIVENKWYLIAIVLILAIFIYARSYMRKH